MLHVMLPCTTYCRDVLTLMTLLPPLAPAVLLAVGVVLHGLAQAMHSAAQ